MDFDGWGELFAIPFMLSLPLGLFVTGYAVRKYFEEEQNMGSCLFGIIAFAVLYFPIVWFLTFVLGVVFGFFREGFSFFR